MIESPSIDYPLWMLEGSNKSIHRNGESCKYHFLPKDMCVGEAWNYLSNIEKQKSTQLLQTTHLVGQTTSLEDSENILKKLNSKTNFHTLEYKLHGIETPEEVGELYDVFCEWGKPYLSTKSPIEDFPSFPKIIPSLKNLATRAIVSTINKDPKNEKEIFSLLPDNLKRYIHNIIACNTEEEKEEVSVGIRVSIADPMPPSYSDPEGEHVYQLEKQRFHDRISQRSWRSSHVFLVSNPNGIQNNIRNKNFIMFEGDIMSPDHSGQSLANTEKILKDICTCMQHEEGEENWLSSHGLCKNNHCTSAFRRTNPVWRNFISARNAFKTFGNLREDNSGVWKNDRFTITIAMTSSSPSLLDLMLDHLQSTLSSKGILPISDQSTTRSEETLAWFGTSWKSKVFPNMEPYGNSERNSGPAYSSENFLLPNEVRDVVCSLRHAEVHFDLSLEIPKLKKGEFLNSSKVIRDLLEPEPESVPSNHSSNNNNQSPSFLDRVSQIFFPSTKPEPVTSPPTVIKNLLCNNPAEGLYKCSIILHKFPSFTGDDNKNCQLHLGCFDCGYTRFHFPHRSHFHFSGSFCALHKSVLLFDHLNPDGLHMTPHGIRWALMPGIFDSSFASRLPEVRDMKGLVCPSQITDMFGGLGIGRISSRLFYWYHKDMNELIVE